MDAPLSILSNLKDPNELQELPKQDLETLRLLVRKDLFVFAKGVLGFDWLHPIIHLPLCEMLEQYEDEDFSRLQITLPRTWLKTTLCSQSYPMWRAIRNPNVRVLLVQNTFTNAVSKLKVIKQTFEKNPLFRILFPEILPTSDCTWKSESLCINRPLTNLTESTFEAAGIRTQVISRHYDIVIQDDTVAPDLDDLGENNLCPKKEDVVQAIGYHRLVPPLLVDLKHSQILVVGTRWFEKDLISWIQDHEPQYKFYTRACLEDDSGEPSESGTVTYPERFDKKVLEGLKHSLGPYMFSCLYLNLPLRSQDMVFREEWFRYYTEVPQDVICYTTVDPAGDPDDTKGEADFNVVLTCAKDLKSGLIYVLDYFREKCSPGDLLNALFAHIRKYRPVMVGLETTQYQKSLKYWIREKQRQEQLYFMVESLTHTTRSKSARIAGLQPVFASASIYMRMYMTDLRHELLSFPLGANDDLIDALASQLELWAATRSVADDSREQARKDPLSVLGAINELQERAENRDSTPLVFDVFREKVFL